MRKFLRHSFWIAGFILLLHLEGVAQGNVVTGTVTTSADNTPLPGVTVALKGQSSGTVTDAAGKFSIAASPSDVLIFSFIGMETQEVSVGNSTTLNVTLTESVESLQEVVVVGYGEQKKTNLTGAVATVDTKALDSRPIADVGRGLQGLTPGMNIVIPSGEVGSDPLIRIRGQFGSTQGSATPLILLDNVEIPSIQLVNPDDIESISVLKDAASASIYGAKAAFGVILITTKKGASKQGVTVSYSGNLSFSNLSKKMEMAGVDGMEYTLLATERVGATRAGAFWFVTREGWERAKKWEERWGDVVQPNDPMLYGRDWYLNTDNLKIGLRTYDPYDYMVKEWNPTQIHNLSVNGMNGKTTYNIGLGLVDQNGLIKPAKEDNFKRYNGSIQLTTEASSWLRFNVGAIYSKRRKEYPYTTSSATVDPWLYLYRWGPTYPMTTEDGDPIRSPASEMAAANTAYLDHVYTSLNGGVTITPMKNWEIKFDFTHANQEFTNLRPGTRFTARNSWTAPLLKLDENGDQIYVNDAGAVVPSTADGAMPAYQLSYDTYTAPGANPDHIYRYAQNEQWNTINLYTTYGLQLAEDHAFKFMAGMNRVGYAVNDHWAQRTQLIDINNPQFRLATGLQTSNGDANWDSQLGFFGRVNYNFREKYLFEGNIRRDGSSKFPQRLWWNTFPSFSVGWRIQEESWMDWSDSFLDELKLRGSWGSIGDQSVSNSLYVPTMSGATNTWLLDGARLYQFGTPAAVSQSVTWQAITTLDVGVDARLFNGAVGVAFDWFQRDTEDMIVPQEGIPPTYGVLPPQSNFGSLRTKGIELQLDYAHRFENGLSITLVATLADAKTEITKYGSTTNIHDWYVGKTYGEIWGYETDRLYQADDFLYENNGEFVETTSEDGYTINQLSDPNAPTQGRLQAGNFVFGPGDVKFKDLNGDGIIAPGALLEDPGDLTVIGNFTPRYEYSFRIGANFKGLDVNIFFQGIGQRQIWGGGFLAIPGFNASDGAMPQAIAGNFWREDRTDAFYPRPYNMANANSGLNMQVQDRYLLDMSYLRMKNITLGYTLPLALSQKARFNKVRVYASLENFFTWDKLGGLPIDPEAITGYSMWHSTDYALGRTGIGIPTFKNASMGLQLSF